MRQTDVVAYRVLEIDRNRRCSQSYMERAIDRYANEVGPIRDTDPPLHPQIITTRATTCAFVDNRNAIALYEKNFRSAEQRRRQLIADLEHYQRQRKFTEVEEAEVVQ